MNTRNRFRRSAFAVMIAAALSVWLQPAMAANSLTPARHQMDAQDRDMRLCKTYVREHHGHPGKGVHVVTVVDRCLKHT
ncbi:hypothetical protein [Steroidobacter sp.]|uniref:hypothetical protein n=1 Tax=Steroidobacter sp. TaxID=1978227 RepID=UPI001A4155C7|nr:hypothetical protein [Steroidobacter sp.]MBL8271563.1 hypothetical protein [Steroidobacter sp.]